MTTYQARTKTAGDYGSSPHAAALRLQLAGLAALEQTEVYREMCAAATTRRLAGGDYSHGWGEFSANGDPRKRRTKAAS